MSRSKLRQLSIQIKSTSEIKKTTNAMRLVSMSSHIKLRQIKLKLDSYKKELNRLLDNVKALPKEQVEIKLEEKKQKVNFGKDLIIVIGSQKGLCGFFNAGIIQYFYQQIQEIKDHDLLVIGKHLRNALLYQKIEAKFAYDEFNLKKINAISQEISNFVLTSSYDRIIIYSTRPKGFFTAKYETTIFTPSDFITSIDFIPIGDNYNFEQSYKETLNFLGILNLNANITEILLNSLLSEASSRFLSMDSATRNAEDLIASLKLDYNKLRQASITRELTDLSGSMMLLN
jgi:F-type H+-transporting ATPase subunit gamma